MSLTDVQRKTYSERALRIVEAANLRRTALSDDTIVEIISLIAMIQEQAFEEGRYTGGLETWEKFSGQMRELLK